MVSCKDPWAFQLEILKMGPRDCNIPDTERQTTAEINARWNFIKKIM
jgi:hypothetical protein